MNVPENLKAPVDIRVPLDKTFDANKLITVRVGSDPERTFSISEDLIISRCDFFRNALRPDGCWAASEDKEIRLQEEDPQVFAQYVQLLYTSTAPIKQPSTANREEDQENQDLAHLYVMAHKFQDTQSQNLIVDTILFKARTQSDVQKLYLPGVDAINIIYKGTGGNCAARRLVADFQAEAVLMLSADWLNKWSDELPKDFLLDLVIAMRGFLEKQRADYTMWCDPALYHEGDGKKTRTVHSGWSGDEEDDEDSDEGA